MNMRRFARTLLADKAAVSITEFAIVLPVFMILGMYGAEIAWMNAAAMEASQIAVALADNASRLGQTDNSGVTPTITGSDVNSALTGAMEEGRNIDLDGEGRIILSSLEAHPVTGKQYVHWQQCMGSLKKESAHGKPDPTGSLLSKTANGLAVGKTKITAPPGSAVMVAEVWYTYRGVFGTMFVQPFVMHEQAAIIVRDNRNLGPGISNPKSSNGC
ncbi:MAG: pilus assembly protein TadE [Novosphingobium sp.]|nr:pilus assembly protein TadE [Novosphingobium sp.]